MTTVDINSLNIQQLISVKKQLDGELTHLTQSYSQLKRVLIQFNQSIDSLSQVNESNKDKKCLLPLTSSLYLPGKLSNHENVIIDIGTGYYVKMTTQQGTKYYKSKVDYVNTNLGQLQKTLESKQDNANIVVQLIQSKLNAGENPS